MSPCSRNVGDTSTGGQLSLLAPQAARGCPLSPLPPLGPASLPCFFPLPSLQGWTGRDVIRQGRCSASALSSAVTAGAVGDFRFAHRPHQGRPESQWKGSLILGEGYPGILCSCPLVLHGVTPPPRWWSPRQLHCPTLLQWACLLAALPALRCTLGSTPHSCPGSPHRISSSPTPTPTPSTTSPTRPDLPYVFSSPGNVLSN